MKKDKMMTRLTHASDYNFSKKLGSMVSQPEVVPIYMNTVHAFDDVPSLDAVYEGQAEGYVYSRMANPGIDAVRELLIAAEESEDALVFSSGMAAIIHTIISQVKSGDHIIASPVLYGGVYDYFMHELPRFGVETTFVNLQTEDIASHIKPNTKLIYTEMISNPLMEVENIPEIVKIAHAHGCKLMVDNTFATPCIAQPLKMGADIVVYSATKYLGGHSDITGGAVLGSYETISQVGRVLSLYGPIMGPLEAWLLTRSLRTLDLRMRVHSENALKVAEFFEAHPKIERVYYPGLSSSPYKELSQQLFTKGMCGGMLSADLAGGEKAASKFILESKKFKLVPSLACVSTSISYPAKTSHRSYSKEDMKQAGITMGQLRFSIGLEDIDDILEEMDRVLKIL